MSEIKKMGKRGPKLGAAKDYVAVYRTKKTPEGKIEPYGRRLRVSPEKAQQEGYIRAQDQSSTFEQERDRGYRGRYVQNIEALQGEKERDPDITSKPPSQADEEFDPQNPERLHVHFGYNKPHKVSMVHSGDDSAIEHRNERQRYERSYYGAKPKDWLQRTGTTFKETKINIPKIGVVNAHSYSNPTVGKVYFTDNDKTGKFNVIIPKKNIARSFENEREAVKYLKDTFERANVKKSLDNFIEKASLLFKINDFISDEKDMLDLPIIITKFKSGDTSVQLLGEDDKYSVKVNNDTIIDEVDLKRAIAKFYKEISKIVENQTEDKDIALDLFGEKVVQTNRGAINKLANLGKSQEVLWLKQFDYSLLDLPFEENTILES